MFIHIGHKLSAVAKETTGAVEEQCRKFTLHYTQLRRGCQLTVWVVILQSTVNDNVLRIITCIGLWMRTVGFWTEKYQAFTTSSSEKRGYRRGLGISNRTSLRETLGKPIREALDLLRVS